MGKDMFDNINTNAINASFKHPTSATVYINKVGIIVLFTTFVYQHFLSTFSPPSL